MVPLWANGECPHKLLQLLPKLLSESRSSSRSFLSFGLINMGDVSPCCDLKIHEIFVVTIRIFHYIIAIGLLPNSGDV